MYARARNHATDLAHKHSGLGASVALREDRPTTNECSNQRLRLPTGPPLGMMTRSLENYPFPGGEDGCCKTPRPAPITWGSIKGGNGLFPRSPAASHLVGPRSAGLETAPIHQGEPSCATQPVLRSQAMATACRLARSNRRLEQEQNAMHQSSGARPLLFHPSS